ncbi:hypothetical protein LCGC14_2758520, partial [marine sediment metagenome]
MLSHPGRRDRAYVFTADPLLATDLQERISSHPDTWQYEVVLPENGRMSDSIAAIERMAPLSVSGRVLILDVRSRTLPQLQHAYNKVSGYNRWDMHRLCYTILIGDGPRNLFDAGQSLDVFVPHLATLKQDYHPAIFFFDPFLHYANHEEDAIDVRWAYDLPEAMPKRLATRFQQEDISVAEARQYFRAASLSGSQRLEAVKRRQGLLAEL